jgi:hypothetical protein
MNSLRKVRKTFVSRKTSFLHDFTVFGRAAQRKPMQSPHDDYIVDLLDECARRYSDPSNLKPVRRMIRPKDFWCAIGSDSAWSAWANIVAKVCRRRGVTLLFNVPPHLNVTDEEYRNEFRPGFVERVRQAFSPFDNVIVLDHANLRAINYSDTVWIIRNGVAFNQGYTPNVIGRLKLARVMIRELLERRLLNPDEAPPQYLGPAWEGERHLPPPLQLEFVPEEDCRRVQEQLLEEGELKLSRIREGDAP